MKRIFYLSLCLITCYALWTCEVENLHETQESPRLTVTFEVQHETPCEVPCQVFFDNQSEGATTYEWDLGNSESETREDFTYTYETAGNYLVRLNASGPNNQQGEATEQISVIDPECPIVADFTITNNSCEAPCEVTFSNDSNNATIFHWDFGDNTSDTIPNPSHTYAAAGNYTVVLTASDGNCEVMSSKVVSIKACDVTAAFDINNNNCTAPCEVSFTNNSANATSYIWNFGDGSPSVDAVSPSHIYTVSGSYQVTLLAKGEDCERIATRVVTISSCDVVAGFTVGNNNCKTPCSISFNASNSQNATSFSWNMGDGTIKEGVSISHTYHLVRDYNVVLTASDGICSSQSARTISTSWNTFQVAPPERLSSGGIVQNPDGSYMMTGFTNLGLNLKLYRLSASGFLEEWGEDITGWGDELGGEIIRTADNGYAIIESYSRNQDPREVRFIKMSAMGQVEDISHFGKENENWIGQDIEQTPDGGYLILVTSYASNSSNKRMFLMKIEEFFGTEEWQLSYSGDFGVYGRDMTKLNDGNYLLLGSEETTRNVYLTKVRPNGSVIWTKTFGGDDLITGASIIATTDGGFAMVGSKGGGWNSKIYLMKFSSSGSTQWTQEFGEVGENTGSGIAQTLDGGYIITGGYLKLGDGFPSYYLLKTDASGQEEWAKILAEDYSVGRKVIQTLDRGYITIGENNSLISDFSIFKTDDQGNIN